MNSRAELRRRYEGVRIDSIPRRERWRLYRAYPRHALRYFRILFRLHCPLPGDTFVAVARDLYARCGGVDGDDVVLELRSGIAMLWTGGDWDAIPVGGMREIVRINRHEFVRSGFVPT